MFRQVKKLLVYVVYILCLVFSLTTNCDYSHAGDVFDDGWTGGGGGHGGGCGNVPEPSTLLLLGAGFGALYFTRRKNKK